MTEAIVDFSVLGRASQESRTYSAGDIIFSAGEAASELFVVKQGSVDLKINDRVVETVSEGGAFGEMALIDSEPRSATAVAATDVTLVPVSEKQFLFMVTEAPYFALGIMRLLASRLRIANSRAA
jgi:CRP/FNR family transcriptional regulator, cyclic AMP receptor protein